MARLTIEKMYQGEYWTNVYWLAGSVGDAGSPAAAIINAERAIHLDNVLFTKARIDDGVEDTDLFATIIINAFGLREFGTNQMLPLFNVLRVDFAAGGGRPSRKYLRGCLTESFVNFNTIETAQVTFFQTNYASVVAEVTAYQDVDAEDVTSGVVYPFVAMRQLRRASKKKTTPSSPTPV